MPRYVRNRLRVDTINRFGQQVGLPLFEEKAPDHIVARMKRAPKSMPLATDTRKLGELTAKIDELKLAEKQQKVLDVIIECGPITNTEIAHKLDWPINRVVGRTFELRQYGLVVPAGKRACGVTRMVVQTWTVK